MLSIHLYPFFAVVNRINLKKKELLRPTVFLFGNAPLLAMQSPAQPLPSLDTVLRKLSYHAPDVAMYFCGVFFAFTLHAYYRYRQEKKERGLPAD